MATRLENKIRACNVVKESFANKRVLQEYMYDLAKVLVDIIHDELQTDIEQQVSTVDANVNLEQPRRPGRPRKLAAPVQAA